MTSPESVKSLEEYVAAFGEDLAVRLGGGDNDPSSTTQTLWASVQWPHAARQFWLSHVQGEIQSESLRLLLLGLESAIASAEADMVAAARNLRLPEGSFEVEDPSGSNIYQLQELYISRLRKALLQVAFDAVLLQLADLRNASQLGQVFLRTQMRTNDAHLVIRQPIVTFRDQRLSAYLGSFQAAFNELIAMPEDVVAHPNSFFILTSSLVSFSRTESGSVNPAVEDLVGAMGWDKDTADPAARRAGLWSEIQLFEQMESLAANPPYPKFSERESWLFENFHPEILSAYQPLYTNLLKMIIQAHLIEARYEFSRSSLIQWRQADPSTRQASFEEQLLALQRATAEARRANGRAFHNIVLGFLVHMRGARQGQ